MAKFTDALAKAVDTIEKPKPKPAGTYMSVISGMPKIRTMMAQGEEREILSFPTRPMAPVEVEDQEALASAGDLTSWMPMAVEFWDGEAGEYAAVQFCINVLGIDPGPKGKAKTLGQLCAEANGRQLLTVYENYPYQDKAGDQQIGTRIKSTAKA